MPKRTTRDEFDGPAREPLQAIELKLPRPVLAALNRVAREQFETRAAVIRRYIRAGLRKDGEDTLAERARH
jgi:metal-responsive CopG/Arc/MetJ family transcriptional regulator